MQEDQEQEKTPELEEHAAAEQAPPKTPKNWWQILQLMGAYLVAAWTLLQFLDWILSRNQISPHWVDLSLWLFLGILPSFLFYLLHKERLDQRQLVRKDKILFSGNLLLLIIVLFFGFRSTDLGATTAEVRYIAADGTFDYRTIIKPEFRKGIALNKFEGEGIDSAMQQWANRGIPVLLSYDMHQDKAVNVSYNPRAVSMTDKIDNTSLIDFFVDGTYAFKDGVYTVSPKLYKARNGKLLSHRSFSGEDLLTVLDSISVYLRREAGISDALMEASTDMPLEEFTSSSFPAIRNFCEGTWAGMERALELDSTFALASFELGKDLFHRYYSDLDTKFYLDQAYRHRGKLPLDRQYAVLAYHQIVNHDLKAAAATLHLQLETDPESNTLHHDLVSVYRLNLQLDELLDFTRAWYDQNPAAAAVAYGNALLLNLKADEIIKKTKPYLLLSPNHQLILSYVFKAHLIDQNWEAALDILKKIQLIRPDFAEPLKVVEESVRYQKEHALSAERYREFIGWMRNFSTVGMAKVLPNPKDDRRLIWHLSQLTTPLFALSDQKILDIGYTWGWVETIELVRDSNDRAYMYRHDVITGENEKSRQYFTWKIDSLILKAESLLLARDFDGAELAYLKAIAANPNHYFLKDELAYIEYAKTKSSTELLEQYQSVAGSYGDRYFWVENGRLFYKRKASKDSYYPIIELFPMSENRYCNLTRQQINMAFEYRDGKAVASYSYVYNLDKAEWSKNEDPKDNVVKDGTDTRNK